MLSKAFFRSFAPKPPIDIKSGFALVIVWCRAGKKAISCTDDVKFSDTHDAYMHVTYTVPLHYLSQTWPISQSQSHVPLTWAKHDPFHKANLMSPLPKPNMTHFTKPIPCPPYLSQTWPISQSQSHVPLTWAKHDPFHKANLMSPLPEPNPPLILLHIC